MTRVEMKAMKAAVSLGLVATVLVGVSPPVPSGAATTGWMPERFVTTESSVFFPIAVNESGDVAGQGFVGEWGVGESYQAAVWDPDTGVTVLGLLPGGYVSEATALNDVGVVVGEADITDGRHAFVWDQLGGMRDLGVLPGAPANQDYSRATDVNNAGQVVGWSSGAGSGYETPFQWTETGGMVELPTPPGTIMGKAEAINDNGVIVGWVVDGNWEASALRWEGGTYSVLPSMPGTPAWRPVDINDSGWVVGGTGRTGVLLHPTDGLVDLGLAPGGYNATRPEAINDNGVVVGETLLDTVIGGETPPPTRGFVWEDGNLTLLDGAEGGSTGAADINDSDVVIGREVSLGDPSGDWPIRWSRQVDSGDTEPPVLTLPSSVVVEAEGWWRQAVTYDASAFDTVDGAVPIICTPPSGAGFLLGSTEVACTAADRAGNTANGRFSVHVVDTTPPRLTLAGAITVEATSLSGITFEPYVRGYDLVDQATEVICSPPTGPTAFPWGVTQVECSTTDSAGNTASGSFSVTVVNAIPRALDFVVQATEDDPTLVTGFYGWDPNGDPISYRVTSPPTHGTLSGSPPGSLYYTPALNYCGSDSFTYVANDGRVDSTPATASINVDCFNDPPVVQPVSVTVAEGATATFRVTASDPDGDPLTYRWGMVTNLTGVFTLTPPLADYYGSYMHSNPILVCDQSACRAANLAVRYTPVGDKPKSASTSYYASLYWVCVDSSFFDVDSQADSNFAVRVSWGDGKASNLAHWRSRIDFALDEPPFTVRERFYDGCHFYPRPPRGRTRAYTATFTFVDRRDGNVTQTRRITVRG